MMLLEQCGHVVAKDLATVTGLDENQIHACWVLGHVTGLLFCFYVKIFLPSTFNSANF